MDKNLIRNFSIIAHIDHGKSTLADRILEYTGAIDKRHLKAQLLDDMDLERERGITIKASAVRLNYKAHDGKTYMFNLIDTPGHVDFSFEVKKSLAACEGAILLVDASQGIEAQTVANLYLAMENNITIVPVINKVDLANARPDEIKQQIQDILAFDKQDIILASAKEGTGIEEILERIVRDVPAPKGDDNNQLQALIFDSVFDAYKGVIAYVRVFNGVLKPGMKIKMMFDNKTYDIEEVGVFRPKHEKIDMLTTGEVGYITCNIKVPKDVANGDTITDANNPASEALPGYLKMQPMVYAGIYPVNSKDFSFLKEAIEKLSLTDASLTFEQESSASLGFGFRCGFLGLLHMEIVQERLEREYDMSIVVTTPSVVYKVVTNKGEILEVDNPTELPDPANIGHIEEPYILASLIVPTDSMGSIMDLAMNRRGKYRSTEYLTKERVRLVYEMPLAEAIVDFYDKIKSMTRGYGSLDYEFKDYRNSELVKLDVLINGEICDALSLIVNKEKAYQKGRDLVSKLRELIPRQLFEVRIQAAIGSHVIAAESVRPLGKNVTAKCYGGDITRKRKLWEKQKEGKKRMKQFGKVEIPQEAFLAVLKIK